MHPIRPRRSVLYMPGSNARAIDKARGLAADVLILDLEDAVAPAAKDPARELLRQQTGVGGFGRREVLVRINGPDTLWGHKDVAAVAQMPIDGVVLPKVETPDALIAAEAALDAAGARLDLPLWAMIETPLGVLNAQAIAASRRRLAGLIMGTSDLSKEARIPHTPGRVGFLYALSHCVLAARAYGRAVIDGVHLDLDDSATFAAHCEQALQLGFDGKSLIHPRQLAVANQTFSPAPAALEQARALIHAWDEARAAGQGVCVLNGRLIENLHVEEAQRVLALHAAILDLQET